MNLTGQIAMVTGASCGIGRAISLSLVGAGATIVLVSRTVAELDIRPTNP